MVLVRFVGGFRTYVKKKDANTTATLCLVASHQESFVQMPRHNARVYLGDDDEQRKRATGVNGKTLAKRGNSYFVHGTC